MTLKKFLIALGIISIVLTLLPLVAWNFWWIRMFDFPHLQLTFLTLIALLVYFLRFDINSKNDYFFALALVTCFVFQLMKIWPYTRLAPFEVLPAKNGSIDNALKIYTSNVYQKNREWEKVVKDATKYDPDIMLFTETHGWWANKIDAAFSSRYPYQKAVPFDNTYGMHFLSKLPLTDVRVNYLVDDSIPSIHGKVRLRNNKIVQFYAIHPTPPMPQENPKSTERDAELMMVAIKSMESEIPIVVIGDFNDVAWSQSTKRFQQISGLLDIRKGRGFYNTYNANYLLLRWPLDHLFISDDFRFGEMKRGADINSDHFPFYATIYLEEHLSEEQRKAPPTKSELERARQEIKKARKEQREENRN